MKKTLSQNLIVLGGFSALALAMGVGRFAYTPMLPGMQMEYNFNDSVAGAIASANYAGYLIGALLCTHAFVIAKTKIVFRVSLILSIATTLLMGFSNTLFSWIFFRFFGGIASAGIFVLGSAIILSKRQFGRSSLNPILIYSGVGAGIALTGIFSPLFINWIGVQWAWVGLGVICLPMAAISWITIQPDMKPHTTQPIPKKEASISRQFLPWLVAAYFCEGFGYIISGTFLVVIIQTIPSLSISGDVAWIVVGIAAAVSILAFRTLQKIITPVRLLIWSHLLQGIGILLPAISTHWIAIFSGAFLFGGTFMGIVALTLLIGKTLTPEKSQKTIALLTAVYGIGQILGPICSGFLSTQTGSYTLSLSLAALFVIAGGFCLIVGLYQTNPQLKKEKNYALRQH